MYGWIVAQFRYFERISKEVGLIEAIRLRVAEVLRRPVVVLTIHRTKVAIRPRTPDRVVALSTLGDEFEQLGKFLAPDFDGLIVDGGGYIGTAALKLAQLFPAAKIVSVEPSDRNFELLCRNTAGMERIEPVRAALAPIAGQSIELYDRGTGEWGLTIVKNPNDRVDAPSLQQVQTISLREIAANHPGREIGLLKLDIEGGEKALFEQDAAELKCIPAIFVELHDRIVEGCTAAFDAFSQDRQVRNFGGEKFLSFLS